MQTRISKANVSRWRDGTSKRGKPVPANYLALLKSVEYKADNWDLLADDWACPICNKSKSQIVYVGDQGQVRFSVATTGRTWHETPKICGHCSKVHMALKNEVKSHLGDFRDSYSFVSPSELAQIISPIPHADHQVRPAEAKYLLSKILANYRPDE